MNILASWRYEGSALVTFKKGKSLEFLVASLEILVASLEILLASLEIHAASLEITLRSLEIMLLFHIFGNPYLNLAHTISRNSAAVSRIPRWFSRDGRLSLVALASRAPE